MANSGSNSALKFTGIAVLVIAGSAFMGWLLAGGGHAPTPTPSTQVATETSGAATPPVAENSSAVRPSTPRNRSDDYTAPGAPSIRIREEATPTLKRPKPEDKPKPDPEASQEDAPPPAPAPETTTSGTAPDASPTLTTPPAGTETPPAPPATGDTDYEKTPTPAAGDSEASQQGEVVPLRGPIYRVQAGTFDQARNAHMLADVLRDRGYTTSTVAEKRSDKTVYHVQTGAYRNKATAKQSALDLQRMGYP
ncbi:MAG: SPOR domain-containing protein, partial [Capsulimonas sp.]|uniref:SPOR domain-containing protein n=1 Tax=Capsulimonas sp. TaxID=2494211 RepID=UPI003262D1F3